MGKRWRRTASFGIPTISLPAAVHIVSVTFDPINISAIWVFDSNIVTEGTANGFLVNADGATNKPAIGINFVNYGGYDDDPLPTSPWQMVASLCVGWVFANGGSLVDATGTVL